MIKKSLTISIAVLFITACNSSKFHGSSEPKFKISDKQMKQFILERNNIEQCIYPQLQNSSNAQNEVYKKQSNAERLAMEPLLRDKLRVIIGEKNFFIWERDKASQEYLSEKQRLLSNNISKIDPKECEIIKQDFPKIKEHFENLEKQAIAEKREAEKRKLIKEKKEEQEKIAQQIEAKKRKIQEEKEQRAREAYLRTPAGQAELARQQQAEYQRQMLEEQRAYQQKMLEMQKAIAYEAHQQNMNQVINSINNNRTKMTYCNKIAGTVMCNTY